jgi:hypothetical protein
VPEDAHAVTPAARRYVRGLRDGHSFTRTAARRKFPRRVRMGGGVVPPLDPWCATCGMLILEVYRR